MLLIPNVLESMKNSSLSSETVLTVHNRLVPFQDVDVILQLSELCLHFLKNSFDLLVWPCVEAVVDVIAMLCGGRTDWGAISVISWLG